MIGTLHIKRLEFEPQTFHFSKFKICEQNSLQIKLQKGGKAPCGLQHTLDLADSYMAGDLMLFQTYRKDKSIIFSFSHLALSQRLAYQFWNWNRKTASVKITPVRLTTICSLYWYNEIWTSIIKKKKILLFINIWEIYI